MGLLSTAALAAAALTALPTATSRPHSDIKSNPWVRAKPDGITAAPHKYDYESGLGLAIRFFDVQRSGALESAEGGNQVPWKKDQLLKVRSCSQFDSANMLACGKHIVMLPRWHWAPSAPVPARQEPTC